MTQEKSEFFWQYCQDNACSDGSDAERFADVAGDMVTEAKGEIDRLTKELSSQVSASTRNNHLRIKELEEALNKAVDCIGEIGSESEDYAVQEELRLILVKGK